jgi:nitrogen fixation protein NifB
MNNHPCFSEQAHHTFGRLHLPIAPACNIQCRYCERKFDCASESRPGVTSMVMGEEEALAYAADYLRQHEETTVVGVAGPGEPLANDATFRVMEKIEGVIKCVSTNGLLLPERLDDLVRCNVTALTVTINTLRTETAERLYTGVDVKTLLDNQQLGAFMAVQKGLHVKINTVLVAGVNDTEELVTGVAAFAGEIGAEVMNVNPLVPAGALKESIPPACKKVIALRLAAERYIRQFRCCRQCRADAAGIPGREPRVTIPSGEAEKALT